MASSRESGWYDGPCIPQIFVFVVRTTVDVVKIASDG